MFQDNQHNTHILKTLHYVVRQFAGFTLRFLQVNMYLKLHTLMKGLFDFYTRNKIVFFLIDWVLLMLDRFCGQFCFINFRVSLQHRELSLNIREWNIFLECQPKSDHLFIGCNNQLNKWQCHLLSLSIRSPCILWNLKFKLKF